MIKTSYKLVTQSAPTVNNGELQTYVLIMYCKIWLKRFSFRISYY